MVLLSWSFDGHFKWANSPAAQTCGGHCPLFCCGCGYCGLCAVPPIQDQERITCN